MSSLSIEKLELDLAVARARRDALSEHLAVLRRERYRKWWAKRAKTVRARWKRMRDAHRLAQEPYVKRLGWLCSRRSGLRLTRG